jgi:hypothetical protein
MANIRVRSTDGSNSDDGSTWALAKLDLHTATTGGLAAAGAGGICYVSDNHVGAYTTGITYTGGTLADPIKIICSDDSADPPTAKLATAVESTNVGATATFQGSFYWDGIEFTTAFVATVTFTFTGFLGPYKQRFDNCKFIAIKIC